MEQPKIIEIQYTVDPASAVLTVTDEIGESIIALKFLIRLGISTETAPAESADAPFVPKTFVVLFTTHGEPAAFIFDDKAKGQKFYDDIAKVAFPSAKKKKAVKSKPVATKPVKKKNRS